MLSAYNSVHGMPIKPSENKNYCAIKYTAMLISKTHGSHHLQSCHAYLQNYYETRDHGKLRLSRYKIITKQSFFTPLYFFVKTHCTHQNMWCFKSECLLRFSLVLRSKFINQKKLNVKTLSRPIGPYGPNEMVGHDFTWRHLKCNHIFN